MIQPLWAYQVMQNATIDTQLVMRIPIRCEQSGSTGKVVFKEIQAEPLKLDDWLELSKSNTLKVEIYGVVADKPQWDAAHPPVGNRFKANFAVSPDLKNTCYALVKGGWLPLFYALSESNIIADRNMVSEIQARFSNGVMSPHDRDHDDFMDYMDEKNCSCTIHTISYALEGNQKELPSKSVMKEQHRAALKIITKALPHIKTWPKEDSDLQYVVDLADQLRAYFIEGVKVLTKVAPLLVNSPSRSRRVERWKKIAEIARSENVSIHHVAFLACLSASTANQNFNPAQKLIKPSAYYTEQDAYNAMYDLFLIMIANVFQTQSPERKVALVTRDKNLAHFWMGLTFADPKIPGQQMIGLHEKLLPVSPDEMKELTAILGEERITPDWTLPRPPLF